MNTQPVPQFPEKEFEHKQFTFSNEEFASLLTHHTLITIGKLAQELANNVINTMCLPRVNQKGGEGVQVLYDLGEKTFTIYTPRNLCSLCKEKKGVYTWMEKQYCESCYELVNHQQNDPQKGEHGPQTLAGTKGSPDTN